MTDLQLALLILGAFIILGVIIFNWWQERNIRLEADRRFNGPEQDVLMDELQHSSSATAFNPGTDHTAAFAEHEAEADLAVTPAADNPSHSRPDSRERIEPTFTSAAHPEPAAADNAHAGVTPDQDSVSQELLEPAAGLAQPQAEASLPDLINQQIDLIAMLYLPQPTTGLVLRKFLLSLVDIDKPIYAYGLDSEHHWQLLTREQEGNLFSRTVCNIQLADRSGPISKMSLYRFQQAIDAMGLQQRAQVEWLGSADPLRHANELDQFCIEVDKMVGFHLIQGENGPFTGTKFRGLAEASGLRLEEDGGFHFLSDHEQRLFSIFNQDNHPFSTDMLRTSVIHGITFQLDIPRVKGCLETFNQMVLMAHQMQKSLNARLVDDNQRPLGDSQIEKIREQLRIIHATMVARGVVPGSDIALRLFS